MIIVYIISWFFVVIIWKYKIIYQIKIENKDSINKLIITLHKYINNSYLKTKRINLSYAIKYKKKSVIKCMNTLTTKYTLFSTIKEDYF